ncbi:MAG: hypothetical protein IKN55_09745, partial [Oscillospiraceae bacterium]|nr:hypothetical protein [Oscillospiraceae bacterium]
LHRNSLLGASPAASFLYNLTKNLAAHLHHQLCAVLPICEFFRSVKRQIAAVYRDTGTMAGGSRCAAGASL